MTPLLLGTKHGPEIERWIREACEANDFPELAEEIRWEFNSRFGRKMGDANYGRKRIRLSAPLWPRATPEQRKQTVKHEACHLLAYELHGRDGKGHGERWKECMRTAGLDPRRCHSVDTTGARGNMRRYPAHCACREHMITSVRVNRIKRRGEGAYTCRTCHHGLKLGRKP